MWLKFPISESVNDLVNKLSIASQVKVRSKKIIIGNLKLCVKVLH